ncbi:IS66 family insertion sequence hypothetical protein [Streptococcus pseudopneumoniae]|uniref:Transposase n=2 Tax=Streptococcus pseudopneumoniae TaxID=257758 RepID=A0A3A4N0E5_9STRE|nr:IS66 family insertion sequence hypothetical protein [Streptococcus pseudopneumoniae]
MLSQVKFFSFVVDVKTALKPFTGMVKDFGYYNKRFENGRLTWPSTEKDVKALTPEQVDWLMKGFSITPKINSSESRDFY